MARSRSLAVTTLSLIMGWTCQAGLAAQAPQAPVADPIPARSEGIGPHQRIVLRNVTIVTGTGAPAQGPYDLVKDGIIYDARKLRAEVREMVLREKSQRNVGPGPMKIEAVDHAH